MDCVWNCYLKCRSRPRRRNLRHSYQVHTVEGEEEHRRQLSPNAISIEIPPQNNEPYVIHESEGNRPGIIGENSGTISSCFSAFRLSPSCFWKIWWSELFIPRRVCELSTQRRYSDSQLLPNTASNESTDQEQVLLQLAPTPTDSNISSISVNSSASNRQTGSGINAESSECIQLLWRHGINQVAGIYRVENSRSSHSNTNSNSSQAAVANLGTDLQ